MRINKVGWDPQWAIFNAQLLVTAQGATAPTSYHLSMLVGECDWVIDARFGPDCSRFWSGGFGARYTAPKGAPEEFAEVVDREAVAAGLVEQIGRQIPLVLAPVPA